MADAKQGKIFVIYYKYLQLFARGMDFLLRQNRFLYILKRCGIQFGHLTL